MSVVGQVELKENTLLVSGDISFTNVVKICSLGKQYIDNIADVVVNLSDIESSDSSGLLLLTGWVRHARSQHKSIELMKTPQFLLDLGRVSGVDTLLPIKS